MSGGGGGGDEYEVGINLTAFLDVLTNLLFFLMFGYAAQQFSMEVGDVVLPESTTEIAPSRDPKVIVGSKEIRVDEQFIAPVRNWQIVAKDDKDGRIAPLFRHLSVLKEKRGGAIKDGEFIMVLVDKDAPYNLVRKVMLTSAEAGFVKFRMVALMQ